ncbi:hypothetical protein RB195_006404 [Necator americanus]
MVVRGSQCDQNDDEFKLESDTEREETVEQELLTCCYCQAPLVPVPLNSDEKTGDQRFFWACRNMKKKTCYFPMGMPNQVFWLTRTKEERQAGFFPRPAVRLLPRAYRCFYPTVFREDASSKSPSTCCLSSMSSTHNESFSCATLTHSPSTSTSSLSTDTSAVDHLLNLDSDQNCARTSIWGSSMANSKGTRTTSSAPSGQLDSDMNVDGACASAEKCSSTCSSNESADFALADIICEQLHNMGVDPLLTGDDELVKQMSSAVRKLKKIGGVHRLRMLTPTQYRASVDHLFNLDVAPIKRKLKVTSTELTRAVAVMRSQCDVDTMLDAMGGNSLPEEPTAKRLKSIDVKAELRRRVEDLLEKLAEERHAVCNGDTRNEDNAPADGNASPERGPGGEKEWFDGEDGPSTSTEAQTSASALASSAEEERLNAIVQSKIRSHIANSAARRHAHRSRKQKELARQIPQTSHNLVRRQIECVSSHPSQADVTTRSQCFVSSNDPLSFDFPYMEDSFAEDSSLSFIREGSTESQQQVVVSDQQQISDNAHSIHSVHNSPRSPTSLNDHLDLSLFGDYEFLC